MKKLIFTFVLMTAAAFTALSDVKPTAAECTNLCQTVLAIASTNLPMAQRYYERSKLASFYYVDTSTLTRWIDSQLGPAGIRISNGRWHEATSTEAPFPIMANNTFSNLQIYAVFPAFSALARKYGVVMTPAALTGASMAELVSVLNDYVALTNKMYINRLSITYVNSIKPLMVKKAPALVKRYLRRQGKSFVTTADGVNPMEVPLRELTTALNAPRFDGLNAWLEKMSVSAAVDVSPLPSSAEIAALRNDLLYGERDITDKDTYILNLCLGVDGYNAFVKEYNGESD